MLREKPRQGEAKVVAEQRANAREGIANSEAKVRLRLRWSGRASLCEKASPWAAQQVADNKMRTCSHRQFVTKRAADNKMRMHSGKCS